MTPFKSLEQYVQGGKSETFLYALNACEQIQAYKQWLQFALCQTIREELTIVIYRDSQAQRTTDELDGL